MPALRIILGDQLSPSLTALDGCDKDNDLILMCEVQGEASYVKHHKKKIAFLFSAMRHFKETLLENGYRLRYTKLDDPLNARSLAGEAARCLDEFSFDRIVVTHPGEFRVLVEIQSWEEKFALPVEIRADNRFLCSPEEFEQWAEQRKQLRMEYFYRHMRQRYSVLMNPDGPVGGKWNYDAENRKPPKEGLDIPRPYQSQPDDITNDVLNIMADFFDDHFGELEGFHYAVTHAQAKVALSSFIDQRLPQFGDYQDAMIEGEAWMFHAHIGLYLNCGLLLPMECIEAAEKAYDQGKAPLNAVEGFIRQILGWREFVRGIYWLKMPDYADQNYFDANRPLPDFYWTAETQMNCLRQCVLETKANAYAHHIQRLMVLGNFALIAGLSPKDVNEWFLVVYADAYEWVELPNVSGMVLFADGGILASKPYAAGGSYINKMSNYCTSCRYKVAKKNGPDACPFNYLYWDFLVRNREKLAPNPRIGMMYRTYDRMGKDKKQAIGEDTHRFLKSITP